MSSDLGKRARPEGRVSADGGSSSRSAWSPAEDCMLLAATEAASLDFDLVLGAFGACFLHSRTAKSLRAHYFRLKRLELCPLPVLVAFAKCVVQLWNGDRMDAKDGEEVFKDQTQSFALQAFKDACTELATGSAPTVLPLILDDDDSKDDIDVDCDADAGPVEEGPREDSSDSTVSVSDDGKRRRTGSSSSPTLASSPLSPTSLSAETFGLVPSAAELERGLSVAAPTLSSAVDTAAPAPAAPARSAGKFRRGVKILSNTPLSPLDTFTQEQIATHLQALQAEAFVRRFRPTIMRLFDHHLNLGVFNEPVNPITLGLPDYFTIVDVPMDLGTVRQKLEGGEYSNVDELSVDVNLVFNNALRYNPEGHPVHIAARRMLDEYTAAVKKLCGKADVDMAKRALHACSFCQGESCALCGDKCLVFDPVIYVCDCCGERIRRSTVFYRSGAGHRWCGKCVINGGTNCIVGGTKPPKVSRAQMLQRRRSFGLMPTLEPAPAVPPTRFVLRMNIAQGSLSAQERVDPTVADIGAPCSPGISPSASPLIDSSVRPPSTRLEKRRNDDLVAEPWVQCDSCKHWVHQICGMFNSRKNAMLATSAVYVCPNCRYDSLDAAHKPSVGRPAAAAPPAAPEPPATDFMSAASLPCTQMSCEIEERVRRRMAASAGADLANSLVVREVSSVPQTLEVSPALRALLTCPSPSPATVQSVLADFMSVSEGSPAVTVDGAADEAPAVVEPPSPPVVVLPPPPPAADDATPPGVVFQYPVSFPYRQRVLLLFQRLDGVDVCLFGLYVQEYGADAPAPNSGRVYIAYLDSVRYLRPLQARTPIYHELLCAYMANARLRGFVGANIWACPPQRGDGYIFHCHPLQQRTPDKRRLRAWYMQLLSQSQSEGVVDTVTQLADEYFAEDGSALLSNGLPPFFAGDYWAVEAERVLRDIARLRAKPKGKAAKPPVATTEPSLPASPMLPPLAVARGSSGSEKPAQRLRFVKQKDDGAAAEPMPAPAELHRLSSAESVSELADGEAAEAADPEADPPAVSSFTQADLEKFDLVRLVGSKIRNMRSDFLVVKFKPLDASQQDAAAAATSSCDATQQIFCDFFDTRSGFLRMCQGNNYQFDSLRRAKQSSMMILWHLHNPSIPAFAVVCNVCDEDIGGGTRFHCDTCEDFDMCSDCRFNTTHPHTLRAVPGSWSS